MDSNKNMIQTQQQSLPSLRGGVQIQQSTTPFLAPKPPLLHRVTPKPQVAANPQPIGGPLSQADDIKMKKAILVHAMEAKRNGNAREFYDLINKQSFMNAREDAKALRLWVRVFTESISQILHEFHDRELLELLIFKLPWFNATTTHGQCFGSFLRLVMAVLPHDVSYIHKVINHIFSSQGLFQCTMSGEQQLQQRQASVLGDLLWMKVQTVINDTMKLRRNCRMVKTEESAAPIKVEQVAESGNQAVTEQDMIKVKQFLQEIRTVDDIKERTSRIMNKLALQEPSGLTQVVDPVSEMFLRAVFMFHPTRSEGLSDMDEQKIYVGQCMGQSTYYIVTSDQITLGLKPVDNDAISVKKSIVQIAQELTRQQRDSIEEKYKESSLKSIGMLLAKMMELYPTCATPLIMQSLVENLPHKMKAVEGQYFYFRFAFDVARICPNSEERLLDGIVDRLCQQDVDIKSKKALRKCHIFSSLSKVQPMNQYLKELGVKVPSEKETKMGIIFEKLLEYVRERITKPREDELGQNSDQFMMLLLKIFQERIFPLHKANFMQYLPLFVIALGSEIEDPVIAERCKNFSERLISFFIFRAFNIFEKYHLSVRQHAWNYLVSLISREQNIIKTKTLIKSLTIAIQSFKSQVREKQGRTLSDFSMTEASESEAQKLEGSSQERHFLHSFIQGLALVIVTKHQYLQREDPCLYTEICKLVFKKYFKQSLIYCSPIILADLIRVTQQKSGNSGLSFFKTKVYDLFKRQKEEMQTSKLEVYLKLSRFFPYDSPYYLFPQNDLLLRSLVHDEFMLTPTCSQQSNVAFNFESESGIAQNNGQPGVSSSLPEETVFENEDSKMTFGGRAEPIGVKNSEIDVPTSGQEDTILIHQNADKIQEPALSQDLQSQHVLYEPDITKIPSLKNSESSKTIEDLRKLNLTEAITLSRQTDALFNVNKTFSAEVHVTESQELALNQRNPSTLSLMELQKLEGPSEEQKVPAFCQTEVHMMETQSIEGIEAQSGIETECSSKFHKSEGMRKFTKHQAKIYIPDQTESEHSKMMTEKQKKRQRLTTSFNNITSTLKEDNQLADKTPSIWSFLDRRVSTRANKGKRVLKM